MKFNALRFSVFIQVLQNKSGLIIFYREFRAVLINVLKKCMILLKKINLSFT